MIKYIKLKLYFLLIKILQNFVFSYKQYDSESLVEFSSEIRRKLLVNILKYTRETLKQKNKRKARHIK